MDRPTLRQLEYAVAVADERSFRRAAEACRISQPALSEQVRALETTLGVRLFERDRRRVLVTPEGAALVERARETLDRADALVAAARHAGRPLSGRLRLGAIPTVAPYVLPRALPVLRRAAPDLSLALVEEPTERLVAALRAGRLDVLLLALEADLGEAETLPLLSDPLLLAVPADHALARRRTARETDLHGAELLLLDETHCLRHQALAACAEPSPTARADVRASSLATVVRLVAAGLGPTLLPASAAATEVREGDPVRLLPLTRPTRARTIGLAFRRTTPRREELERLGELMVEDPPRGTVVVRR